MKKLSKIVATCMAVALSASVMTGCAPQGEAKAVSYVGLDINPEITLSLDKNDKVLSVYAGNEDAKIMLYGESLEGLKIDVAVDKIADIAVELGYVSDKNYGINFTVEGKINKQDFIEKAKAKFIEKAGSIDLNFTEDGKYTFQDAEYDLVTTFITDTYSLLMTVKEDNGTYTYGLYTVDGIHLKTLTDINANNYEPTYLCHDDSHVTIDLCGEKFTLNR